MLRPGNKLDIGRIEHDPGRLKAIYDMGRETALAQLEGIKNTLQNKSLAK